MAIPALCPSQALCNLSAEWVGESDAEPYGPLDSHHPQMEPTRAAHTPGLTLSPQARDSGCLPLITPPLPTFTSPLQFPQPVLADLGQLLVSTYRKWG